MSYDPFKKSVYEFTTGSRPPERPDDFDSGRLAGSRYKMEEVGNVALVNPRPFVPLADARNLQSGQAVTVSAGGADTNGIVVDGQVIAEAEPVEEIPYQEQPFYSEPAIAAPQQDLTPLGPETLEPPPEYVEVPYEPPAPVPYEPPVVTEETAPAGGTGEVTYTSEYAGTITVRDADGNVIGYLDSNTLEPL